MTTPAPQTLLIRAAMDAAQAAQHIGTVELLSTAVSLLRDACDLTAMLHDDGSDPDVFVLPADVQAALDDALAVEARMAEALDEMLLAPPRLEDGEGSV